MLHAASYPSVIDSATDALIDAASDVAFQFATNENLNKEVLGWLYSELLDSVPFTWSDPAFESASEAMVSFPLDAVLLESDLVKPRQFWFFPSAPWNEDSPTLPGPQRTSAVAIFRVESFTRRSGPGFAAVLFCEFAGFTRRFLPWFFVQWRDNEPWLSASAEDVSGRHIEPDSAESTFLGNWMRLTVSGQFWLRTRVPALTAATGNRGQRKRLLRAGNDETPLVVTLRATERKDVEAVSDVAWSCRWRVRDHWRKQFLPSLGMHRPTLVHGYVKGPTSKPFRAHSGIAYRVSR